MLSRNLIIVIALSVLAFAMMVCVIVGCMWWQANHYLDVLDKASKI